jgi:hypothetical protein
MKPNLARFAEDAMRDGAGVPSTKRLELTERLERVDHPNAHDEAKRIAKASAEFKSMDNTRNCI